MAAAAIYHLLSHLESILSSADSTDDGALSAAAQHDERRNLHEDLEEDPPYGTPTELDDDTLDAITSSVTDGTVSTTSVARFWAISATIFASLAFLLVLFCKRYGADLVEDWVNGRASGELSEASYASRVLRRRAAEAEAKKECPEKRKVRLVQRLEQEGVVMTVKEPDFVNNDTDRTTTSSDASTQDVDLECGGGRVPSNEDEATTENDNNDDDAISHHSMSTTNAPPHIQLPPPPAPNGSRQIPNCCAICLCPYEIDDTLIWSSNASCQHAFHKECVVEWLGKMQDGTPCPCCRQTFVELPPHDEGGGLRKRLSSDMTRRTSVLESDVRAFDIHRISLR